MKQDGIQKKKKIGEHRTVLKKESKEKICNYLENRGIETRDMTPLINHHFIKNTYKKELLKKLSEPSRY